MIKTDKTVGLTAAALLLLPLLVGCKADPHPYHGVADGGPIPATELVKGLDLTEVRLYQGVEIKLMADGEPVADQAVPVVADRDAMIRLFVQREPDWEPREVYGRVDFENSEGNQVQQSVYVDFDSTEANLATTLNLDIPGEYLSPETEITVSLREVDDDADGSGDKDGAEWPEDDSYALDARDTELPLQLVLVPVRYNADGSGRLPDTSDTQIETYRERMFTQYPTTEVEITIADPLDWNSNISAWGGGWDTLLNAIVQLRSTNGAATNEYYYGAFSPADTFEQFCGMGCVAGMSLLAMNPTDAQMRASIGLGFSGVMSAETMVHEVGHAHGREHAPCGLGGQPSDPGYPYPGALIGERGYDLVTSQLIDPATYVDFMSYCTPTWVSDYTYNGLLDRIVAVNALASMQLPDGFTERWVSLAIGIDGVTRRGPDLELQFPPSDPYERTVELLDASGTVIDQVVGYLQPYADLPGGLVLFPEPTDDVVAARLPGEPAIPL